MRRKPASMLIVFGVLGSLGRAAAAQEPQVPAVIANGEHVMYATPDRAFATATAESRARRPQEAQQQNARTTTTVIEKVKAAGIPDSAIRTIGVSLEPEFDYQDDRQTLRGYVARNTIEITIDDLARLGSILDAAVTAGATSIGGIRFDVRDRQALERKALELATRDALARAEAIASGANRTITGVQQIVERRERPEPRPIMMAARVAAAAPDTPTPVVPGEVEIRAAVTLTALFK